MNPKVVTSKQNQLLKSIRHAADESRSCAREFVVAEGLRTVREAAKSGHVLEAGLLSQSYCASAEARADLDSWFSPGMRVYCTADSIFKSVSRVRSPQGILALVRVPELELEKVPLPRNPLILCACGIQDPGNLGTLVRTATAAQASMLCTTPGSVSARNPKAIRASAGTFFHIPVIEHVSIRRLTELSLQRKMTLYRADASAGCSYLDCDFRLPCAILLGNESAGISADEWQGAISISIPTSPLVESLNVATAGAIILFEICRQRFLKLPQDLA
jgi:RNA methyltransferase, TrmH family